MDNHIMCLCIYFDVAPFVDDCSSNRVSETKVTPKTKTVKPVYHQHGKQTPLIMSIKSHFPLSLAYACLGDHHDTFYRIVEPIPMHDLSFCHRIKQTTILEDSGIV